MIKIEDKEHFASVAEFALNAGAADKLNQAVAYLAGYGDGKNICMLHKDWAPASFAFAMHRPDGTFWFNGGLIYSGPTQPLDGSGPAFTVGIGQSTGQHDWSVHT